MTINHVFQELTKLIDQSQGSAIALPSGVRMAFRQRRKFTFSDLDDLEQSTNVRFPEEYRALLTTVGAAECFVDETGRTSVEVYDPAEVGALYADFFPDCRAMQRYLPVACDNRLQEIVVLLLERPGPENVLLVSHDTHPDDWPDLLTEAEATSLEAWLLEALSSDGHLEPH